MANSQQTIYQYRLKMPRFLLAQFIFIVGIWSCPIAVDAQNAADRAQAAGNAAISSLAKDDDESNQDDGWLTRFLFEMGGKPDSLDFVLREIDLTDQQRKRMVHSAGEFLKNYREKSRVVDEIHKRNFFAHKKQFQSELAAATAKRDQLLKTVVKQVREELLDHQVKRLIQIIKQRIYIIADVEPFEFPLLAKDLKLSPDQRTRLKASVEKQKSRFKIEKQNLRKEAWLEILKKLPDELQGETILLIDPDGTLGLKKSETEK